MLTNSNLIVSRPRYSSGGLVLAAGLLLAACAATSSACAADADWTGFRGHGDSHAAAGLPLNWGDEQNVAWKCALPGYGQSSPVVWEGRAFVTAVQGDEKQALLAASIEISSGQILWQKEFPASQTVKSTDYVSRAAPTPVVDEKHVYFFFESGDLLALKHDGELVWKRSLTKEYGDFKGNHGIGSSPAQSAEALFLLADHDGPAYLLAIDKQTGANLWKKDREPRVSWSSPVVVPGSQGTEVLISSSGLVQCFAAKDGELIWEVKDLKGNTITSPSVTAEAVLIGSGQPGNNILIRRGGQGDVGATHIAWRAANVSSSFGSPLIHEGRAYFVNKAGVAFAVNMANGETLWSQRLPDSTWASPIAAGDRVYFFCKNGTTVVVRNADTFDKLAENALKVEGRVYGVAVTGGGFLIRSGSELAFVRERQAAAK